MLSQVELHQHYQIKFKVGKTGFEPVISSLSEKRLTRLGHLPFDELSGRTRIRTLGLTVISGAPYARLGHTPVNIDCRKVHSGISTHEYPTQLLLGN